MRYYIATSSNRSPCQSSFPTTFLGWSKVIIRCASNPLPSPPLPSRLIPFHPIPCRDFDGTHGPPQRRSMASAFCIISRGTPALFLDSTASFEFVQMFVLLSSAGNHIGYGFSCPLLRLGLSTFHKVIRLINQGAPLTDIPNWT